MNYSKQIKDGGLILAVVVIFILAIIFIPMITPLVMLILPVPFIIYSEKHNWIPSIFLAIAITILLIILLMNVAAIPLIAFASAGGIMIGSSIYRKEKAYKIWANGTIGFIFGLLFTYLFTQYVFEINWVNEIEVAINESLQMSKEMAEQLNLPQIEDQMEVIEEQILYITDLIPAGIVIISIILAFISQWFSYKYMNRVQGRNLRFPPFRQFKLPAALIWIYFIALLFILFGLKPDELLYVFANNIIVLIGFLFTLQGFSFIFFYAYHKNWSPAIPIISTIVSILIPFLLIYVVRFIGIIDIGFNMRKRLNR